jgi:archaellum biogenesis ATPase FlaH
MTMNENYDEEAGQPEQWDVFAAQPYPETKWKIQGLIPNAGIVILAGASGDGKSWLALEMAKSLVLGIPFLGYFEVSKSNVLYINQEMATSELYRRGKLISFEGNLGKMWVLNRNEFNLNDEENVGWLLEFIYQKIDVVLIDTFRAVAGEVKDDKAEDISNFFQRFKVLKEKNVAMVFLDHTRKPERFDGKIPKKEQLFGSQYKLGAVEVVVMIKKGQQDGEMYIYQVKNRLGVAFKPYKVVMRDVLDEDGQSAIEFVYEGNFEEQENKKDEAKHMITNVLQEGEKTRAELLNISLKEKNIGTKNTSDALRELTNDGKILVKKQGRQNSYSLPSTEEPKENDKLFN